MTAGGKREGSGRKKKEETVTVSFRVNSNNLKKAKAIYGRKLNKKINDFIDAIAKETPKE